MASPAPEPTNISSRAGLDSWLQANKHVALVIFWEEWSDPCKAALERVQEMLQEKDMSNKVRLATILAESHPDICQTYDIKGVPTMIVFHLQTEVFRLVGGRVRDLEPVLNQYSLMPSSAHGGAESGDKSKDLNARLKQLINQAKVMLFMKGTPAEPQCGFSRTITQILNESNLPYSTFNILADNEVREGLKTYSNWKTYPQLYVNGELIGGLDIVKELQASGDLLTTLSEA